MNALTDSSTDSLADRFRALVRRSLPLPGQGQTGQRCAELRRLARHDMSLARLVEAHEDARAIAAELGTDLLDATATYGVWAASGAEPVVASGSSATIRLDGTLPWCGGATIVDRAAGAGATPKEAPATKEYASVEAAVADGFAKIDWGG